MLTTFTTLTTILSFPGDRCGGRGEVARNQAVISISYQALLACHIHNILLGLAGIEGGSGDYRSFHCAPGGSQTHVVNQYFDRPSSASSTKACVTIMIINEPCLFLAYVNSLDVEKKCWILMDTWDNVPLGHHTCMWEIQNTVQHKTFHCIRRHFHNTYI